MCLVRADQRRMKKYTWLQVRIEWFSSVVTFTPRHQIYDRSRTLYRQSAECTELTFPA